MASPDNNSVTSAHVDMNMLSMFASEEMTTSEHVTQTKTSHPTSIAGKLFRIICSVFGMSNGSGHTDANVDSVNKV